MTEDLFKFDIRVRERLQRRGLVSETELKKLVDGLPDLAERAVSVDVRQPALARGDGSAAGAISVGPRAQHPAPFAPPVPAPPLVPKPSLVDIAAQNRSPAVAAVTRPTELSDKAAAETGALSVEAPNPGLAEVPAPQAPDPAPPRLSFAEPVPATVPTGEVPALEISESETDDAEDDVDSSWGTDS